MEVNSFVTVNDVTLINLAFERKLDHFQKYGVEISFSNGYDYRESKLKESFILESLHLSQRTCDVHGYYLHKCYELHFDEMGRNKPESRGTCGETFPLYPPVSDSCESLEKILSLDICMHLISMPFKEKLKQIDPSLRLSRVIDLLLDYHYGHECKMYVSLAVKLCLRTLQSFFYSYSSKMKSNSTYFKRFSAILSIYLNVILNYNCDDLVTMALEVLYVHPEQRESFFNLTPDLGYVLKNIVKTSKVLPKFLHYPEPGRIRSFDLCFVINPQNFVALVTYGASSTSKEDWDCMKLRGMHEYDEQVIARGSIHGFRVHGRSSLRLSQIDCLFEKIKTDEISCCEAEFLLKLLYASISEPFPTEEEVKECLNESIEYTMPSQNNDKSFGSYLYFYHTSNDFHENNNLKSFSETLTDKFQQNLIIRKIRIKPLHDTPRADEVIEAWEWCKEVLDIEGLKTPRSLLHLSRCVIRQSLAVNYQLPNGVHFLNLPISMINYLLLKDCGNNPYEGEVTLD